MPLRVYTINLLSAAMMGGAYDKGAVYPVGLQGHVVTCLFLNKYT